MPDYSQGKIYKLISNHTDLIYIGSTAQKYLSQRKRGHICYYNDYLNGKGRCVSSFEIIKFGDCQIFLIESFPCDNKDELQTREQYWIEKYKDICVNKYKAHNGISRNMPKDERKVLYDKQYRNNNKEQIAEIKKQWRENNKQKILEYKKEYRNKNKEKINEKKRNNKIVCVCGSEVIKDNLARHKRSVKHQNFLNNN